MSLGAKINLMSHFANLENDINQFLSKTEIYLHGGDLLERMQNFMAALGNPEKQLKIIHVAGTSGKTSTCYFAAALLQAAGLKTGLTVSPHIDTVRERAIVDLQVLSENAWVKHMSEFFALAQKTGVKPSYFEFYMGFAFWLFAKLKVDYAVVETGLGGTWDGSNVVRSADKICIITDIGYDHTEILGDTLAAIASEKAGIIHEDNTVFMYPQNQEIMTSMKTRKTQADFDLRVIEDVTKNFMVRNFNLAKAAVDSALQQNGKAPLTAAQIKQARAVVIPARAEQAQYQGKTIIMDGSHNPQKLRSFAKYLDERYPSNSRIVLATFGSNKLATLDESMAILRNITDKIILTSFKNTSLETNMRISIDKPTLISAARRANFKTVKYIDNPHEALQRATDYSTKNPAKQVVITGSFYLLDHLRPHILPKKT